MMRRHFTVPNLITLVRLLLAPIVGFAIVHGEYRTALALAAAAGATDALDGWLARTCGWGSRAGAYLDPVADKVLLCVVYAALGVAGSVPWWLVGIVFGRDVLILAAAGWFLLFTSVRDLPPSAWGKISTGVQIVTALSVMAANAAQVPPLPAAAGILVWVAAAATVWSGLAYARRALALVRTARAAPRRVAD